MAARVKRLNLSSVHREIEKIEKKLEALRDEVVPEGRKIITLKLKFLRDLKKSMDCKRTWAAWPKLRGRTTR
jgi:hypothetical protein